MTTVNDFVDILRIIREQPEWADALRGALLGKDVLELPQRLAELTVAFTEFAAAAEKRFAALESDVVELKSGQARLESDVAELKAGQARLESTVSRLDSTVSRLDSTVSRLDSTVSRLDDRVGGMRGTNYEIKLGKNIDSIIGPRLGIRSVRFLKGSLAGNNAAYQDLMDAAEDRGDITEQERDDVNHTDFILRGRSPIDQSTVYVAVEASVTAGDSDIHRAADRSEILRRATGETSIATVACASFDSDRQRLAQERNVTLITVGE